MITKKHNKHELGFKIILLAAIVSLLSTCKSDPETENKNQVTNNSSFLAGEFRQFLKKIPVLPANTTIFTLECPNDSLLVDMDHGAADTLFIKSDDNAGKIYGILPDTSRHIYLLWYAAVENGALALTTLNKSGTIIDETYLSTDLYGCGCGYHWQGLIYLNPGPSFLMRDTIITYECDSGVAPMNKWKYELATKTADILNNGKIKLSEVKRITLKEPER
ncbi:MAG: hypothetical protein IT236_10640 [Bacteroidia bacterium]|nr:hypothetical protein [Bacteroidia bacterium]